MECKSSQPCLYAEYGLLTSPVQCKAEKNGGIYTKSGKQVVYGNSFPCGSDIGCDMSVSFEASVASSVSREKTTTYTNSEGITHEATVGWMYAGPTATYTFSHSKEFSEVVASSTGASNTDAKSRGVSFRQQVTPGFQYNGKTPSDRLALIAPLTTINRLAGSYSNLPDVDSLVRSRPRPLREM